MADPVNIAALNAAVEVAVAAYEAAAQAPQLNNAARNANADLLAAAVTALDNYRAADAGENGAERDAAADAFEARLNAAVARLVPLPQQLQGAANGLRVAAANAGPIPFNARVQALEGVLGLVPQLGAQLINGENDAARNARVAAATRIRNASREALNVAIRARRNANAADAAAAEAAAAAGLALLPARKSAMMTTRIEEVGARLAACVAAIGADDGDFKTALGGLADSLDAVRGLVGNLAANAAAFNAAYPPAPAAAPAAPAPPARSRAGKVLNATRSALGAAGRGISGAASAAASGIRGAASAAARATRGAANLVSAQAEAERQALRRPAPGPGRRNPLAPPNPNARAPRPPAVGGRRAPKKSLKKRKTVKGKKTRKNRK